MSYSPDQFKREFTAPLRFNADAFYVWRSSTKANKGKPVTGAWILQGSVTHPSTSSLTEVQPQGGALKWQVALYAAYTAIVSYPQQTVQLRCATESWTVPDKADRRVSRVVQIPATYGVAKHFFEPDAISQATSETPGHRIETHIDLAKLDAQIPSFIVASAAVLLDNGYL